MPVIEVRDSGVIQRCSVCERQREVIRTELPQPEDDSDALPMPVCTCGAVEFLVRSPRGERPHPQPGSFGHLHRLLVDALHAAVRERKGAGEDGLATAVARALGGERAKWFPRGPKIDGATAPVHEKDDSNEP